LVVLIALSAAGCARSQQAYMIDPAQPAPVAYQQQAPQPQYVQASYPAPQAAATGERGLFNSWHSAQQSPAAQPAPSGDRGLFTAQPPVYLQQPAQPSYAMQAPAPQYTDPRAGRVYSAPPDTFAAASLY
jgi:hypothetical protein